MARIVLTIDYMPLMGGYPADVTTKAEAMQYDIDRVMDGTMMDVELVDYADCLDWKVVE